MTSFSEATITHKFKNADGTPGSGTVQFTLSGRMTNNGTTIAPTSVTAAISETGELSQALTSNVDAGTIPSDTHWRVDIRILGASEETFTIVVPTGGGTVDLGSLLPQQPAGG